MPSFDLAFIGFGAAAMSLIMRLEPSYKGRIAIIEPRELPQNNQTWCGWPLKQHAFSDHATRRWPHWAVSHHGKEVARTGQYAYEMLSASRVQTVSLQAAQRRADWQLFKGSSLKNASFGNNQWALELDTGEKIDADYVLDSRPPSIHIQRPWLWQSFVGREVIGQFDSDPDTVRIMDFIPSSSALVTFVYELPLTANHRLVEITQFTPTPANTDTLNTLLDEQLGLRGLSTATIYREEQGHLPMQPIASYHHQQWLKIGTAGGSMRPATGYAFHAIQTWADQCAEGILTGKGPTAPQRRRLMDWLDGVFLESLWQAPDQAPDRFMRLFERTAPDALIRFLMGQPKAKDLLSVISALPVRPLLKAALTRGLKTT